MLEEDLIANLEFLGQKLALIQTKKQIYNNSDKIRSLYGSQRDPSFMHAVRQEIEAIYEPLRFVRNMGGTFCFYGPYRIRYDQLKSLLFVSQAHLKLESSPLNDLVKLQSCVRAVMGLRIILEERQHWDVEHLCKVDGFREALILLLSRKGVYREMNDQLFAKKWEDFDKACKNRFIEDKPLFSLEAVSEFSDLDLRMVRPSFSYVHLNAVIFRNVQAHSFIVNSSTLHSCSFEGAFMSLTAYNTTFIDCNFVQSQIQSSQFSSCTLKSCDFDRSDLEGVVFEDVDVEGSDFRRAKNLTREQVLSMTNWAKAKLPSEFSDLIGSTVGSLSLAEGPASGGLSLVEKGSSGALSLADSEGSSSSDSDPEPSKKKKPWWKFWK